MLGVQPADVSTRRSSHPLSFPQRIFTVSIQLLQLRATSLSIVVIPQGHACSSVFYTAAELETAQLDEREHSNLRLITKFSLHRSILQFVKNINIPH